MALSKLNKIFIVLILSFISIIGFMIKLPRVFSQHDKALHFLFYFFAAFTLNFLWANSNEKLLNFLKHIAIAFFLGFFGIFIEIAQELSNHLVTKRIHGNFDPEDIFFNILGLIFFSGIWMVYKIGKMLLNV